MGSAVLFTDPQDRVLLVEPTYRQDWGVPGGTVEPDESPRAAAMREVHEELGLLIRPGRLLVVDWVPPHDGRTESVVFGYAGPALSAADVERIRLPPDELRSWAWCSWEQAQERLTDLNARRLRQAIRAREQGETVYLESGYTVD
jgi:8-oxo-dGTP pyrophosphatase MutT (NUDIX family)